MKELKSSVEPWLKIEEDAGALKELAEIVENDDSETIADLAKEAQELQKRLDDLELRSYLSDPDSVRNCYLQIHPGAGGTESCDWAEMLMRMYSRWAETKGYAVETIDLQPGDEAGIKNVVFRIIGEYAYGYLKSETGVHRLVRISPFDTNRRRHTSFASVFAYPEVEDNIDVEINESDLRIDTYRSSGAGGQHVNVTDSAVRITHIPTGTVVQCQNERSQHKNRATAMKILRARLYQFYLDERRKEQTKKEKEKKDIAWGSQIRSYVFHPYNMVKDLRTNVETSNTSAVMDGAIDLFIDGFLRQFGGK